MPRPVAPIDQRRRPVAGYPSQTAACLALAEAGLEPGEIARRIGRDGYQVRAILNRVRVGQRVRTLAVPGRLVPELQGAAIARGLKPHELATALLEVIIRDELFDALLGEPEVDRG